MPSIVYTAKYRKNSGSIISPYEVLSLYFYGLSVEGTQGNVFSNETIRTYILSAQQEIERYLSIKFNVQLVEESIDYNRDDYNNGFPILNTTYQVKRPYSLVGLLNRIEQVFYPEGWLMARSSNKERYARYIHVVPTGAAVTEVGGDIILSGVMSQMGLRSFPNVPDYWNVQYSTGFDSIPYDLLNIVGMLAAIPILAIAGDLIFKVPGIASQSLSIDGLSQSISTTSSATSNGYSARIGEYRKQIKETLQRIALNYRGIQFTVI